MKNIVDTSRKSTPWDKKKDKTSMEEFISKKYKKNYKEKHDEPNNISEIKMLNSYKVSYCKYCKSPNIVKRGKKENGLQRYKCNVCKHTFTIFTYYFSAFDYQRFFVFVLASKACNCESIFIFNY